MSDEFVFDHYPMRDNGLPAGWAMCGVGCVAESIASGFPSGAHNSEGRGVPHIRPMNIDREGRFDLSSVKSVDGDIPKLLAKGDVLFNNTNSPELIGKTTVIPIDDKLAYSNHMTRIRLEQGMNPSFVAKQLHFLWMSGYFRHRCKNHVNQASIAADPLSRSVPLLVAPSAQQDRIADELDELLSDLDAGVAALERVRAKLGQYRAAVLKAAVEGELTADWRKKHPATEPASELLTRILAERRRRWEEAQLQKFKDADRAPPKDWKEKYPEPVVPDTTDLPTLPAGWCWATVDQCADIIQYGTSAKTNSDASGVPVLRMGNIRTDGTLDLGDLKYLPAAHDEFPALLLYDGDLLFNRTNSAELVGKTGHFRGRPSPCSYASYLIRVRLLEGVSSEIVAYALNSTFGRQWVRTVVTQMVGQANVNGTKLASFAFPLAPQREQSALVESTEDQLSVIDHLEGDIDARLQSSTGLRQSILRHAFTGQLVPQNAGDESASELLKRIAAEREERERQAQAEKQSKPKTKTPRKRAAKARK